MLAPDFKDMVGWPTLAMSDIELGDRTLGLKPVKNFVTLVAIKVQNLINEVNLCKTRLGNQINCQPLTPSNSQSDS